MTIDEMYDALTEIEGINVEVVDTITGLYGYNEKVLHDILWYYTGYRSFAEYIASLG